MLWTRNRKVVPHCLALELSMRKAEEKMGRKKPNEMPPQGMA